MTEQNWLYEFGDNLRSMLHEQKYTQRELADAAGVNEATISRYLSGTAIPRITVLLNIAYVLDCSLDDLVDFNERIVF